MLAIKPSQTCKSPCPGRLLRHVSVAHVGYQRKLEVPLSGMFDRLHNTYCPNPEASPAPNRFPCLWSVLRCLWRSTGGFQGFKPFGVGGWRIASQRFFSTGSQKFERLSSVRKRAAFPPVPFNIIYTSKQIKEHMYSYMYIQVLQEDSVVYFIRFNIQ